MRRPITRKLTTLLCLLILCLPAVMCAGTARADVYASPGGLDANAGTLAAPVRTLTQAQALARSQGASGNHIYLRGGAYAAPLSLNSADSGETWTAFNGETPVISGALPLTGWTLHDAGSNIWQASVPAGTDFRQIYVNGLRASRVSTTNVAALLPGGTQTSSGYTCTSATPMASWGNPSNIEFIYNSQWTNSRIEVTSLTATTVTLSSVFWGIVRNPSAPVPLLNVGLPTAIENAYALLSASTPGQFYLDRTASVVYYVPRPGEDLATASVTYPSVQSLLTVSGATGVTFHRVQFSDSTWTGPDQSGFGVLPVQSNLLYQTASAFVNVPSAVNISGGSTGTVFDSCVFRRLGADGLFVAVGSSNTRISGNLFTDQSGSAVDVTTYPTDKASAVTGLRINSNTVHDVSVEYRSGAGINVVYGDGASIDHNLIYNLPYTCISVGLGWGFDQPNSRRNNMVTANVMHDFMTLLSDGGGLYTNDNDPGEADTGNVCYNLRLVGGGIIGSQASCYYMDDGSLGKTLTNNVGYNINQQQGHFNNNIGPNTFQYNFFDAGSFYDGPGALTTAANVYLGNADVGSLIPASLTNAAGLEPAYGGTVIAPLATLTCPQFLTVQATNGGTSALLNWTTPNSDPNGLRLYEVWMGATLIGTTTSTAWTTLPITTGTTPSFTVDAVDTAANVSARSNSASLSF